jgi:hypothetical protein
MPPGYMAPAGLGYTGPGGGSGPAGAGPGHKVAGPAGPGYIYGPVAGL